MVEGEVVVRSETQTYTAKKGAFVRIPRGVAIHHFTNKTQELAQLLCVVVPAGLEQMFEEIGQPVACGQVLPPLAMTPELLQKVQTVAAKYGQEVFPPDTLKK